MDQPTVTIWEGAQTEIRKDIVIGVDISGEMASAIGAFMRLGYKFDLVRVSGDRGQHWIELAVQKPAHSS